MLAELVFENIVSLKRVATLELKGAGATGELGERWSLMVVMTALGLCYLRQTGRACKGTIAMEEKILRRK